MMSQTISRREMMKRCAIGGFFAGVSGSFLASCTSAKTYNDEETNRKKPNILFIFADDWGWGDLSCHGNKWLSTPNLDRLASQGTEFYQFNVNNPVCSPSRTAVMTGHVPARYSVHQHFSTVENHIQMGMPDWLDPKAPMLPRIFKQAGYVTGHFGKWHLTNTRVSDAPLPSEYGYDEYGVFNCPGPQMHVNETCNKAIDFIKRHHNEPFFINLWVHETHTPHYPSEQSLERYSNLDKQHQVYAAVVADGDRRIGEVLDTLKQLELENDTLVVFSTDNGPEITGKPAPGKSGDNLAKGGLGEYYSVGTTGGLRGRKRSLYEGGVRVPFMVRWPGKVPVGKINETTEITAVDLLPTFCAAAGIKLPQGYVPDGENMLSAFQGKQISRTKPIFWEWQGGHQGDNWPCLGVRHEQWKLLMTFDRSHVELYDVPTDRSESKNLADQHPDVVKKLIAMIEKWKAELPTSPPSNCISKMRQDKIIP
jgi:N-acetylgalactosamine-6-sulfatase